MNDTRVFLLVIALSVLVVARFSRGAEETGTNETKGVSNGTVSSICPGDEEARLLLALARRSIQTYLETGKCLDASAVAAVPSWAEHKGCFVTLTSNGSLRGCIGTIVPRARLCDCVMANAVHAAVHDRRFPPLTAEELQRVCIEISILTVPQRLSAQAPPDILEAIVPGRDGVILKQGVRQSTYLPQVWEHFADRQSFLCALCKKGGMPPDCWQDPHTEIFTYQVEAVHEVNPKEAPDGE